MAEPRLTFDLNNPRDCKAYIETWIDGDALTLTRNGSPTLLEEGTDEDFLRVAKQLFLYVDPRSFSGERH